MSESGNILADEREKTEDDARGTKRHPEAEKVRVNSQCLVLTVAIQLWGTAPQHQSVIFLLFWCIVMQFLSLSVLLNIVL